MTGSALIGQPARRKFTVSRRFEAGKAYTSSDGTAKAIIGNVRRGKHSSRVLAQVENEWAWYEIGNSGGTELFTAETRRGVFIIMAGREQA